MTSIISLEMAKSWLRFPNPSDSSPDDAIIGNLIDGVQEIIELHTGPLTPTLYVQEKCDGGNHSIFVRNLPLLSVESVIENWGYVQYELDFFEPQVGYQSSIFAYSIDNYETGQITRRSAGGVSIPFVRAVPDGISVTYKAGRATVPMAAQIAACELVAHVYQAALQRGVSMSGSFMQFDSTAGMTLHNPSDGSQVWVGIPTRVLQLLESERRLPVIA